ncbi:uncharacterized protein BJ212DRAFT_1289467, partial [Suillus subaureus]
EKLDKYYEKTTDTAAYVIAMLLDPTSKLTYFKKHWPSNLLNDVLACAENVFEQCYNELNQSLALS